MTARPWLPTDLATLRLWWGVESVQDVATRLGRTEQATCRCARLLGLPRGPRQGTEILTHAAERTGFNVPQLREIITWGKVKTWPTMSFSGTARRSFDPSDLDRAIAAWMQTELVGPAATARGLVRMTLRRWLVEAGHRKPPRQHWRLPSAEIDRVIAARREAETLMEAAARVKVYRGRLRRMLLAAGVSPEGRAWLVPRATVDAVVGRRAAA